MARVRDTDKVEFEHLLCQNVNKVVQFDDSITKAKAKK